MAARREIREFDLLEFSRCALRQPHSVPYSKSLELEAADRAVRTVLWELFEHKAVLTEAAVKAVVQEAWNQVKEEPNDRMKGLPVIVRQITKLTTLIRVVSPVTHYVQKVGMTTVTGDYAVVAPIKQKHLHDLLILRLRSQSEMGRSAKTVRPDVVNWIRWLHLRFHEMTVSSIRILNYGIDLDVQWHDDIPYDETVVRGALTDLADAAQSGWGYPSPGSYCDSCLTQGCMPEVA
jgi:hypothetical protein